MKLSSTYQLKEKETNQINFSIRNMPTAYMDSILKIHSDRTKGIKSCIGLYVTIRNECIEKIKNVLSESEHEVLKNLLLGKKFNPDFATIAFIEQQMSIIADEKNEPLLNKLKSLHPADLYFLIEDLMI